VHSDGYFGMDGGILISTRLPATNKYMTADFHGLVQGLQYKNVAGLSLFYGLNLPLSKKWCGHQVRHDRTEIMLKVALNTIKQTNMRVKCSSSLIKDEVLIAVGCPIFPSILIAKYLTPQRFCIEVPVPSRESQLSYMCLLRVTILPICTIFLWILQNSENV
jgi:hypothetical protein